MKLMVALFALAAAAQEPDPFTPLRVLEGKWEGSAGGEPGKGVSTREHKFEMNGRFLVGRNRLVYEPKPPSTKPEVHEDLGIFSYDRGAKKFVPRQFHLEGFVNEYVQTENPKESYRVISKDEIEETFSLAQPGKDFEVYSRTLLKRVK
jgi:hypothetical protein